MPFLFMFLLTYITLSATASVPLCHVGTNTHRDALHATIELTCHRVFTGLSTRNLWCGHYHMQIGHKEQADGEGKISWPERRWDREAGHRPLSQAPPGVIWSVP